MIMLNSTVTAKNSQRIHLPERPGANVIALGARPGGSQCIAEARPKILGSDVRKSLRRLFVLRSFRRATDQRDDDIGQQHPGHPQDRRADRAVDEDLQPIA